MQSHVHRIREELPAVALFLLAIWGVFLLDLILPLERFGLVPRDFGGLLGVVTMPFLHGSFTHLLNNSVPLAVLLTLLAGSRADSRLAVLVVAILGGVLLWLFGRGNAIHIGASGLVFGLAVFLIVSGIRERRFVPLLVSGFVVFTYGTTLLAGILPWQQGVSWDGHLFGGIAGAIAAFVLVRKVALQT
ncbi:rhomboid family intramembrane serine protease [Candidatus Thiothrix anitrata]|jgi:membrane associated rhomboid family serine protease|uniref:Rhomboid family intramembrane serine protease n=1 Tax=Candidatus Thiothrix anitrata TaxID=2823902 RepID=A0ABX7X8B9_9GAMM|nr:rhomboid family intramembrane serine protease [Candidatus Thiothrix anitrata]QTR51120.1 rhomboid family intramembrane serine protease [Candidatus Thiothrix anitrata]